MILIPPHTAENLFWIGRYIQRAETMARLIIYTFDKILDINPNESFELYSKLGINLTYSNSQEFLRKAIFDLPDVSLLSIISYARENAVLTRSFLPNRMFSRINALYLKYQLAKDDPKLSIFWLESTLHDLDAIWGNIELIIMHLHEKDLIQCGRIIERMDLNIRLFDSFEATALDVARLNDILHKLGCHSSRLSLSSSDPFKTLQQINAVYKTMVIANDTAVS